MRYFNIGLRPIDDKRLTELAKKLETTLSEIVRKAVKLLHEKEIQNLSKTLLVVALCTLALSCGGQNRLPVDNPPPRNTPTPVPTPTPLPVTITADSVLNMGMIGQTWLFMNDFGCSTTFSIQAPAPVNRTNPDGTITVVTFTDPNGFAAGRGGDNLVIYMTKGGTNCYWSFGSPNAEIWFLLHRNTDNSWRSTASIMNLPHGCLWCVPTTAPFIMTSDILDNQPGMPLPYLIAPPTTSTGDHFINETRVNGTGNTFLTFDNMIPSGALSGPSDGEYWRTDFYISNVSTPAYSGPAIVSDQYEGVCGHERWYFAPGRGIVKIESPYDGGQIKGNPICDQYLQVQFRDPRYEPKRIN